MTPILSLVGDVNYTMRWHAVDLSFHSISVLTHPAELVTLINIMYLMDCGRISLD